MSGTESNTVPVEQADFRIRDDGTTFHVRPVSDAGRAWVAEHETKPTWEGGIAIEPRFLDGLIEVIEAAGLRFGPHEGKARIDTYPGESDF